MSRNIEQVYTDNPSTTVNDDDLFYKGNTPYGPTDDSAIKYSDLKNEIVSNGVVTSLNTEEGDVTLVAGANMNVTPNGDGTITLSATSGPSEVTSGQTSFYTELDGGTPIDTVFSGIGVATPIRVDTIAGLFENSFNVTLVSNTPNIQILTAASRRISIDVVITLRTSSILNQIFSLYTYVDNGVSSVLSNPISTISMSPAGSPGPQEISLVSNIEMTGPSDNLQIWISNNSATTDPVYIEACYVKVLDTTQFGGFTSTDVLPQGVNNLYLSTDAGATYQNVLYPVVVGNIATWNTTTGQLYDSGFEAGTASQVLISAASNNASYFPTFIATSATGLKSLRCSTGWTFNPSTGVISVPGVQVSGLSSGSTLVSTDSGKNLNSATGFYTLGGLTFNNGGSGGPLLGTVAPVVFDTILSDGDYINLGGSGRNIGVTSAGTSFISYNLNWDGGSSTYKFNGSGNAFTFEVGPSGIYFKSATSGSSGTPIVPAIGLQMQAAGAIDIPFVTDNSIVARISGTITSAIGGNFSLGGLTLTGLTASSLVLTDSSKQLVSAPNYGITATVTVTVSSQAMSTNTRYINNYAGGQCAYTLPPSTGSGKKIELVSLTTASTSGWKITADGTDKIQFMTKLSVAGGTMTSTIGSAVDCATLSDDASGLWVVYPAAGLDIEVV